MGKEKTINLVFKFILDNLLFNKKDKEGNNKTSLALMLAKYFNKVFVLSSSASKNVIKSVEKKKK